VELLGGRELVGYGGNQGTLLGLGKVTINGSQTFKITIVARKMRPLARDPAIICKPGSNHPRMELLESASEGGDPKAIDDHTKGTALGGTNLAIESVRMAI
jgi:hypothetical protein